jgi:hypothetical protein
MWHRILIVAHLAAAASCWSPSPVDSSVYDRGLVDDKLKSAPPAAFWESRPHSCFRFETLALEGDKYHASTETIRFEGDVVLFASTASSLSHLLPFVSKATVVSAPVIFISRNASSPGTFHVHHHADAPALRDAAARIRAAGARFAPSVTLANCSAHDLDLLFQGASAQNALMSDLVALLRALAADGAVLDFHSCIGRQQSLLLKPQIHRVLAFIGSSILRQKMVSILSVPPVKGSAVVDAQVFAAADFETLEYSFTFFHVPFSAHVLPNPTSNPGPRAPLAWIIKSIRAMLPSGSVKTKRAAKLLASTDFRAALFDRQGGGRYVSHSHLAQLLTSRTGRCAWDGDAMEHSCAPPCCIRPARFCPLTSLQARTLTTAFGTSCFFLPCARCRCYHLT